MADIHITGTRIAAPIPTPAADNVSIRVVLMTDELRHEIAKWRLKVDIWRGYPIIQWGYSGQIRERASESGSEPLRYLLSYDYEYNIREAQTQAMNLKYGRKSYRSK